MKELTDNEKWWRGRAKPVMTKAEFDAMSDADLDRFTAENICRFYQLGTSPIWWEGDMGYPTCFTIEDAPQGSKDVFKFAPCSGEGNSLRILGAMYGHLSKPESGRMMIWRIMLAEGFTPGYRLAEGVR